MNPTEDLEKLLGITKMAIFLKDSWMIDGDCTYIKIVKSAETPEINNGILFKLVDSKRGEFFITLSCHKTNEYLNTYDK